MHYDGGANHLAAKCLPDCLMAQTNSENWHLPCEMLDYLQ